MAVEEAGMIQVQNSNQIFMAGLAKGAVSPIVVFPNDWRFVFEAPCFFQDWDLVIDPACVFEDWGHVTDLVC